MSASSLPVHQEVELVALGLEDLVLGEAERALGGRAVEVLALAAQQPRQPERAADLVDVPLVVDLKERVLLLGVGERAQLDLRAPAVAGARAVGLEDEDLVEVGLALEVLLDEALDARHRRLGERPPETSSAIGGTLLFSK
jgi:hypothetical protein